MLFLQFFQSTGIFLPINPKFFVFFLQNHKAIEMFRNMKVYGVLPDAATYNILIDCCSNMRCYTSACVLLSMMIRDGYPIQTSTYTVLIKVLVLFPSSV